MSDPEQSFRVQIYFSGDEIGEVDVPKGKTILRALEDAGYNLRSGCGVGKCTTCTAKLQDGEVDYIRPPKALSEEKRDQGYIPLCIATPDRDCCVRAGDDVLAEAFPVLWGHLNR